MYVGALSGLIIIDSIGLCKGNCTVHGIYGLNITIFSYTNVVQPTVEFFTSPIHSQITKSLYQMMKATVHSILSAVCAF